MACQESREERELKRNSPAWLVEARESARAYKAREEGAAQGGVEETAETPDAPGRIGKFFGGSRHFTKLPVVSAASVQLPSFGARGGLATKEVRSDSTEDAFGDVRDMEVIAPHSSSNGGVA
eukprot:CAMPEP_0119523500 /NCGR_PEP_ID=MMETSP1344-20130328/38551_1 /TAXON_ID=236787 /ORGANISM="Florenciella parvula, Strain CCMP2471" /LENGTH=121 /DNA_ID=CAMNT_0007561731 /DNA_START=139 /DNA_END=500 /DNA_ORIENTATION=-